MTDFKSTIQTGLVIGTRQIQTRLFLAPMAGLGHIAFRQLISDFGGFGLLFTGMCSAKAIPCENPLISPVFQWRKSELPYLVCQIFGSDPDSMAAAARRIEAEGFWGVDLNFGCSVAAICKKGAGAALLKDPDTAVRIIEHVRKAVSIPVLVKFRTGWENDGKKAADLAIKFEAAGADALTFHPRVAPDRRGRPPQWSHIRTVKESVSIPVFGNGNVFDIQDARNMLEQTGCDGISIGRMAVAKPWLFAQWMKGFEPDQNIYPDTALKLTGLLSHYYNPVFAVKLFKKFVPYYSANFKFGHQIRKKLIEKDTMEAIEESIRTVFASCPELSPRPNLNLFS